MSYRLYSKITQMSIFRIKRVSHFIVFLLFKCFPILLSLRMKRHFHFNLLNAELNPICHLLVLLVDLTFMGPCILSTFQYTCISNKMQNYTVYLYLETTLHVSGGTCTHHQERIQLYLQHLVSVTTLLLSAAIVEELEPVWVCSWWWVQVPPETCRVVSRYK
jgi:hypothetical protein